MKAKLSGLLPFLTLAVVLLVSCGKNEKRTENTAVEEGSVGSVTTNPDEPDQTVNSNDTQNWDEMLDNYEDYVDSYVKFYKKAKEGDQSALSEYPALMEKATSLQQSMMQAQKDNQLSSQQISRLSAIQMKMVQAMTK